MNTIILTVWGILVLAFLYSIDVSLDKVTEYIDDKKEKP